MAPLALMAAASRQSYRNGISEFVSMQAPLQLLYSNFA